MYVKLHPKNLNPTINLPPTLHEFYIWGATCAVVVKLYYLKFEDNNNNNFYSNKIFVTKSLKKFK